MSALTLLQMEGVEIYEWKRENAWTPTQHQAENMLPKPPISIPN